MQARTDMPEPWETQEPYVPTIYDRAEVVDKPIELIKDGKIIQRIDHLLANVKVAGIGELIGMFSKEEIIEYARKYCIENRLPLVMIEHRGSKFVYIHDPKLSEDLRKLDFNGFKKTDGAAMSAIIGPGASIAIDDDKDRWRTASEIVRQLAQRTPETEALIKKYGTQIVYAILSGGILDIKAIVSSSISNIINEIAVGEQMQSEDMNTIAIYSDLVVNALTYAQLHPDEETAVWKGYEKLEAARENLISMFRNYIEDLFDTETIGEDRKRVTSLKDETKDKTVIARQVTQVMETVVEDQDTRDFDYVLELLVQNLIVAILAGTHTTANALTITLRHLPDWQKGIAEEVAGKFGENIDDETMFFKAFINGELPKLYYFIMESLRMDAAVVHKTIRTTSRDIQTPSGTIEAGTNVILPIQAHGHNPEVWENPEVFDPARFGDVITKYSMSVEAPGGTLFNPFEVGIRRCPGGPLAMMEMAYTIALLAYKLHDNGKTPRFLLFNSIIGANVHQVTAAYARLASVQEA